MKTCDLHSSNWALSNESGRDEIKGIQMNVPGDNYSALIRANVIKDPYFGTSEKDCQWVGKEDWSIERKFNFTKRPDQKHFLCMDMVDTFFTVYVNNQMAGEGHNYFRIWRFDITDFLIDGENSIRIVFESSEKHAIQAAAKLPYPVPVSSYDVFSPHRNLVRKIQCHSGWDWGPCLMVSGIYGDIYIDSVYKGYINSVSAETIPLEENKWNGKWKCSITIRYTSFFEEKRSFLFELTGNKLSLVKTARSEIKEGLNIIKTEFTVDNPVLWKSSDELKEEGLEKNNLYTLLVSSVDERAADHMDSVMVKQIGFRELKLNAIPDEYGTSLYYSLNGRKIFAKGANWIPIDSLPERWTPNRYRYFLQSTVDANMNSLRFWGGGQYESEFCYKLCDELGIIVWQDCMFACGLYPTNDEFLENVEREIEDNVLRLQTHPSLAVWCGNNENLGALNWYKESRDSRDKYLVDYDRLNHGVVEKTIKRCDSSRTWWPSSPCSGPDNFGDNWHSDSEGDMHFWSVWHEKKDMEAYLSIKPRFVSEFGYESLNSLEGIREYACEEDLNLTSPVMEWHQRSPGGNSIILENFSRYFRIPEGIKNISYLSQLQQALAVKTAVDYWRSLRPHCMGAIYWQINDVWPVTSWSSIEYSGKWKLLHYAAKKFFRMVNLSLIKKDEKIFACIVNESSKALDLAVRISWIDFNGKILRALDLNKTIKSDSAEYVFEEALSDKQIEAQDNTYFIYAEMDYEGTKITDTLFVNRWKKCSLEKANIQVMAAETGEGKFLLLLNTDKPAFYVNLETEGCKGHFSENMLTLLPGQETTVEFIPSDYGLEEKTKLPTMEEFKSSLKITSLRDTYK